MWGAGVTRVFLSDSFQMSVFPQILQSTIRREPAVKFGTSILHCDHCSKEGRSIDHHCGQPSFLSPYSVSEASVVHTLIVRPMMYKLQPFPWVFPR